MTAFHLTIFTSAFLLFLVQPLIAKQILPWFGGAPSVWSTCLVFFQLALVAGYGYAHLTRRLGIRRQVGLHLLLVLAALVLLPIAPSAAFKPAGADDPSLRVFQLLSTSVGIPYVLLAATAPMLQDWYARARPGHSPYPLYALSNAGSLLALLSFPVAFERFLDGRMQSVLWSAGFLLFAAACAWCGRRAVYAAPPNEAIPAGKPGRGNAPASVDILLWFSLSACGTGLLLAVTNQLCQEVATVPLLWVLPLTVYLVSFILAFAGLYARHLWVPLFVVFVIMGGYMLARAAYVSLPAQAASLLALLAAGCMVCHGELARLKPAVQRLTGFYLTLATGGAAGGTLVALVAPHLFLWYAELPFFVLLTVSLLAVVVFRDQNAKVARPVPVFLYALPLACFVFTTVVVLQQIGHSPGTVAVGRNFYGVLRVVDGPPAQVPRLRRLYHGRVLHGAQFLDPARRQDLTIDFAARSGIQLAFSQHPRRLAGQPLKVGVVGLGAGTIAAFGRSGDTIRFFELNPQVIDFARAHFTFLRDSPADVDIVTGDARISLEAELQRSEHRYTYDLFIVDAFAGAAIPTHLLTRESMALYDQALTPDGVLAVHVSNQHLDLTGVVRGTTREIGVDVIHVIQEADARLGATRSEWMVGSRVPAFVEGLRSLAPGAPSLTRAVVWTDAFSSIVTVLR